MKDGFTALRVLLPWFCWGSLDGLVMPNGLMYFFYLSERKKDGEGDGDSDGDDGGR